ncbi:MAG: alkaline phosphatase family protein [Acidimicrobiales bacterium]
MDRATPSVTATGAGIATTDIPVPHLPDYDGACITNVAAALGYGDAAAPEWLPAPAVAARQVVLLVLDGLGWDQLAAHRPLAPFLSAMTGRSITSVAPTTTATALTSITTGLPPARHEVVGYRVRVDTDDVLNVLRWRTGSGDAMEQVDPAVFQHQPVFGGRQPVVVTRTEFGPTGFTLAHLPGVRLQGWRTSSSLPVVVGEALRVGEPFVYAYYDGIDKIAHERGFGSFYDAELQAADRLVADVAAQLPKGAALVVTADHGQVEVGSATMPIPTDVGELAALVSGEGRFRWLHAHPGRQSELLDACRQAFADVAWIRTVDQLEEEGWYGGPLTVAGRGRLGDVAVIPFAPIAVTDPADSGEFTLRCRHGSATSAEMFVPLLAVRA